VSNRIEIHSKTVDLHRALEAWHQAPLPTFALWQAVVSCAEKLRLAKAQTELL